MLPALAPIVKPTLGNGIAELLTLIWSALPSLSDSRNGVIACYRTESAGLQNHTDKDGSIYDYLHGGP